MIALRAWARSAASTRCRIAAASEQPSAIASSTAARTRSMSMLLDQAQHLNHLARAALLAVPVDQFVEQPIITLRPQPRCRHAASGFEPISAPGLRSSTSR